MPKRSSHAKELARFGANVRRERTRQKITQEKLAEMADLNIRTVQKIEIRWPGGAIQQLVDVAADRTVEATEEVAR